MAIFLAVGLMATLLLSLFLFFFKFSLSPDEEKHQERVITGLEVLVKKDFEPLAGKNIGLITNATAVDSAFNSIIDLFIQSDRINLVALFGPEHGVRGDYDAGAYVESYTDPQTGIPVYSLYGPTRKPSSDMLDGLDVLVYDIQDIGSRSYTYTNTMARAMEAAAKKGIAFMVLDRPNPLGGIRIEGNKPDDFSAGQYAIPYVHGLTVAELALLYKGEGLLKNGIEVDLTVIPMKNWRRDMLFFETGLHWIPTSPHVPYAHSPFYYVTTGIIGELHVFSEGVGYTLPFELFGAEWIDSEKLATLLNNKNIPGIQFRPVSWRPYYGRHYGKRLQGVQLHITDYHQVNLTALNFQLMEAHHELYPDRNPFEIAPERRINRFDHRIICSPEVRKAFETRMRYEDVKGFLDKDVASFRKLSRNYWLYK